MIDAARASCLAFLTSLSAVGCAAQMSVVQLKQVAGETDFRSRINLSIRTVDHEPRGVADADADFSYDRGGSVQWSAAEGRVELDSTGLTGAFSLLGPPSVRYRSADEQRRLVYIPPGGEPVEVALPAGPALDLLGVTAWRKPDGATRVLITYEPFGDPALSILARAEASYAADSPGGPRPASETIQGPDTGTLVIDLPPPADGASGPAEVLVEAQRFSTMMTRFHLPPFRVVRLHAVRKRSAGAAILPAQPKDAQAPPSRPDAHRMISPDGRFVAEVIAEQGGPELAEDRSGRLEVRRLGWEGEGKALANVPGLLPVAWHPSRPLLLADSAGIPCDSPRYRVLIINEAGDQAEVADREINAISTIWSFAGWGEDGEEAVFVTMPTVVQPMEHRVKLPR